jgi:uncharacterized membrane protein
MEFFAFVIGICLWIFWMVVAWRLMRATERIADTVNRLEKKLSPIGDHPKNANE